MNIYQIAQRATDLDRASDFYTDLLGTPPTGRFEPPGLLFFQAGQTRLLLETNAPSAMIYLLVDNIVERIEGLRAKGTEIVSEPHVIFRHENDDLGPAGTEEWQAFFRDSEDNLVGLIEHR